jgi:hypothetical protein
LPQQLLNKLHLQRLRIYISAQNLFTITKYKGYGPEAGSITNPVTYSIDYGNVPQLRAFVAGIHVGL